MRELTADHALTEFSPHFEPVAAVGLGERFTVHTVDCYDGQISHESVLRPHVDMVRFNRATGPVSVTGTVPGEWARIVIESIEVTSPGVMAVTPGLGVLGHTIDRPSTRLLEVSGGRAWLTPELGIPLDPMVGILGVATARETVPSSTPGEHGGNLDTRVLRAGMALAVRVNQPGLGLCVGDLHAAMGDGELGGTGIEIAGKVRLRVERLHEHTGRWPLVLGAEEVQVLASRATLDNAVRAAFHEAVTLMARWHDLDWADAYRLTSVVSDMRVSQVVNPRATVRLAIPAQWCPASLLNSG